MVMISANDRAGSAAPDLADLSVEAAGVNHRGRLAQR